MDEKNIQQFYNGIPILEYPGLLKVRYCTTVEYLYFGNDWDGLKCLNYRRYPHNSSNLYTPLKACMHRGIVSGS